MGPLSLVAIDIPDYPTYEQLHMLHLILYIPLEIMLVLPNFTVRYLCVVFVTHRTIFNLGRFKRLVIFRNIGQ